MMERLSPNIEPDNTEAEIRVASMSLIPTKPATMGVRVEIAPTEVPEANDKNDAEMNTPAYRYFGER